jgi:ankyrin repeat protein
MNTIDIHGYARMNLVEELRSAIHKGVDLNKKDIFGATALHYAVAEKHQAIVALLLENGADVAVQDKDGKTALHYAIEYNIPEMAELLIKQDPAVIAISDQFGNQPLWTATFNSKGDYSLVLLLLRHGADPKHRNNVNLSPLDIPKRKGDNALLRVFESNEPQQL